MFCFARELLRADAPDFKSWGLETLVTLLYMGDSVEKHALEVLEEAAYAHPEFLAVSLLSLCTHFFLLLPLLLGSTHLNQYLDCEGRG